MEFRIKRVVRWVVLGHAAVAVSLVSLAGCSTSTQWLQWGGPNRNFMVKGAALAQSWPKDGPPKLWSRELGDGFSTILADGDNIYTMYRTDSTEYVVALDAATGETVWEHENPSPFTDLMAAFGAGPSSTPLIVGDRLFTIGTNMVMHCFDKRSGAIRWKQDLVEAFGAEVPGRGYCSSPIAFEDAIIVQVGGNKGRSLMAFRQADGSVAWQKHDFGTSHSSPIIIKLDGQEQLVAFLKEEIVGLDPDSGKLLWSYPLGEARGASLTSPLWTGDDLVFFSSAYDSGSRVIRLNHKDGKTVPEELWYSRKMRIHHANAVRIGDYIYGSSGDFGPAFFMGMNIKTGKVAWRKRGFAKATCILAGDELVILDEDGKLTLATPTPEDLTIHAQCEMTESISWTAPTLVGRTLYLRDRKNIIALDLG